MSERAGRARVFSLCGVDGVGKTSIFKMLSARMSGEEFVFVGRGPADAERLIERRFPRRFGDWRDWVEGEHSHALALACAFDYALFYERVLLPLVGAKHPAAAVRRPRAVITDRHAICFLAYAHCNPDPNPVAVTLLKTIPAPDVIFHVKLPEEVIAERMHTDSVRVEDEFENINAQRRLLRAYETLLPDYPSKVVDVENSGTLEESCELIMAETDKLLM
jgi:thymidylate kinase